MPIYRYSAEGIDPIEPATFSQLGITERSDLQRLLRDRIDIIAPDTLVIAEEFGNWEDSRRRIDLLAIDHDANLVVIELKRTEDGGHMELHAIRYAAMVSTLTFEKAVGVFEQYLRSRNDDRDAEQTLLQFLGWDEPLEDDFADDVRIVLASAEFSRELTTAVLWLCDRGIDIRCVRLRPYGTRDETLLDVQQVIPLPEAEDYQVQMRERHQRERESKRASRDYTRYNVTIDGHLHAALAKRRAVHAIVYALCVSGVTPDEIMKLIPWRSNLFRFVNGTVNSAEFLPAMQQKEPRFDAKRWFTDDESLIHSGDRTYAFTAGWGTRGESVMRLLLEHFQPSNISFGRAI